MFKLGTRIDHPSDDVVCNTLVSCGLYEIENALGDEFCFNPFHRGSRASHVDGHVGD